MPFFDKVALFDNPAGNSIIAESVAAAAAKKARCAYIITRNKRDFAKSPVPALTPGEFLTL